MIVRKKTSIGFIIMLMIFSANYVIAQPGGPGGAPGQRRERTEADIKNQLDKLSERIDLSEEQFNTLLEFEKGLLTEMKTARENNMGDREAMRTAMRAVRDKRTVKYKEVLTEEQMVEYEKIREEQRARRQQNRPEGGRGNSPGGGQERSRGR